MFYLNIIKCDLKSQQSQSSKRVSYSTSISFSSLSTELTLVDLEFTRLQLLDDTLFDYKFSEFDFFHRIPKRTYFPLKIYYPLKNVKLNALSALKL